MLSEADRVRRRRIGFQHERELAIKLWKMGFAVMRAPASGAKASRTKYPDLVAMRNGKIFVFEVKTREKPSTIYIDRGQVMKVIEFARRAGGLAFIAVKIRDGSQWRFIPVDKLSMTPSGNYKLGADEILQGLTLDDLKRLGEQVKSLIEFIQT